MTHPTHRITDPQILTAIRNEIVKHWEQTETNVEWVSVAVSGADGSDTR